MLWRCINRALRAAVIGAALLYSPVAFGLTYNESSASDLGSPTTDIPDLGPLSIGINTISGSLHATCGGGPDCATIADADLEDYFEFTVPAGTEISFVEISITLAPESALVSSQARSASLTIPSLDHVLLFIGSYGVFGPVSAGHKDLGIEDLPFTFFCALDSTCAGTEVAILPWHVDVTLDYVTPPVPLPAALPLFASGLGVMGLLGWRRKRKQTGATAAG